MWCVSYMLDIDICITAVGIHLSTVWNWLCWGAAWGKQVWRIIGYHHTWIFKDVSDSHLCSRSTENSSESTSEQNPPATEVSVSLRGLKSGETLYNPYQCFTLVLCCLLERRSPAFIHVPHWIRPFHPGNFRWQLWPSNAAEHRERPRDRNQAGARCRRITASTRCAAATGPGCSSTTGYAPGRSAHVRGVRQFSSERGCRTRWIFSVWCNEWLFIAFFLLTGLSNNF